VAASNQYVGVLLKPTDENSYKSINITLLLDVAQYVSRILTIFGVIAEDDDQFGFVWPESTGMWRERACVQCE
jgi:hypothetical protein